MCSKTPATFAIFPVLSLGYAHTQSRSFYPHSTVEAAHIRKSTRLSTPAQLQCSHSGTWEPGNETNNALHLFWYYNDQPHTPVSCQIVWKFLQEVLRTNLKNSCSEQDSNGLNYLGHSYFRLCACIITITIHLTCVNVWESMEKPHSCIQFMKSRIFYKSCENPYQYYKSCENLYQVLQVTHAVSECAMKSKVRMIKSLSP